jgi:IclR family transcriptional regulator, acetate operon repressor
LVGWREIERSIGVPATANVEIRALSASDAAGCDGIIHSLPSHFGDPEGREQCARAVRSEQGIVAIADHAVAGFLTSKPWFATTREITWMAVHAEWRGNGIGGRLIEHLAGLATREGRRFLLVTTLSASAGLRSSPPVQGSRIAPVADLDTARKNQSVGKAAALLRASSDFPSGTTVAELARAAALPRATAVRMIEALIAEGLLARAGERGVIVTGPEIFRLAEVRYRREPLIVAARGILSDLALVVRESISLGIAQPPGTIRIVEQIDGPHMLGVADWVGRHFALHASASGKVAIAFWDERVLDALLARPLEPVTPRTICDPEAFRREIAVIRERGYALMLDELEEGLAAVAVPVFLGGMLYAAITATAPTARAGVDELIAFVDPLQEAAREIVLALESGPAQRG